MRRLLILGIALSVIAVFVAMFYIAHAPTSSLPSLSLPYRISYAVSYQNQKIKIGKGSEQNFNEYVNSFHLDNVSKLIFPRKTDLSITGIQHINFILTTYDTLQAIDFMARVPDINALKSNMNTPITDYAQGTHGNVSYAMEHRYDPASKTLSVLLFLSDSMIDSAIASGGQSLELEINDLFLLGLYQVTYQLYQPLSYVDFLQTFGPIEGDLYTHKKTFITIVQ